MVEVWIYTIYRTGYQIEHTEQFKVIFWEFGQLLETPDLHKHDCIDFWNKWLLACVCYVNIDKYIICGNPYNLPY